MIIDGHSHVNLPIQQHIELMDKASVDKTILFSTSIHPENAADFLGMQKEMQQLNEIIRGNTSASTTARLKATKELKEVIAAHPSRYIGFGSVPVGLTEPEISTYIEKEVVGNGFIGLGEFTMPSGSINLLRPIVQSSERFGNLPLWIHAFNPLVLQDIRDIVKLAKDFPSVPIIIGHLGGSNWLETITLIKEISNLYLDISAYFSTLVLKMAINELPHKCIFGVDMPYGDLELSLAAVRKVSNSTTVTNLVLGENIASLLKF